MVQRLFSSLVVLALLLGASPLRAQTSNSASQPAQQNTVVPSGVPNSPNPQIELNLLGRYVPAGIDFDRGAAEIVAHDPATQRIFIVNGQTKSIDIVSILTPTAPTLVKSITMNPTYGGAATSVDVYNGVVAVAVPSEVVTQTGKVVFFDTDGSLLNQVDVGVLPDMITFSPDGKRVLTADEAQPSEYPATAATDPEGSISIVDLSNGVLSATVRTASFTDFNVGGSRNGELDSDVRIFGVGATVAQDLEPEYISISPDGSKAYATLQENNALAIVNVLSATVEAIVPLGFKDHSSTGNGLDASDRDGAGNTAAISITTKPILGMYQPDGIASYMAGDGTLYLVTANEGDARDYGGLTEEARVSTLTLDPTAFPNGAAQGYARLTVTNLLGDTDSDNDFDKLYVFGARSFSIWNAATGALVFDSGDDIEQRTALLYPNNFNANGDSNSPDGRSDNKGPEPEGVELGRINGRAYAFIGLERIGGVMVYDITDPTAPTFVQYVNNRNFSIDPTDSSNDISPEGLTFVAAGNSPTGKPLLLVANELSGSTIIYEISSIGAADESGTLSLIHNNDGESTLLPLDVTVAPNTGYSNSLTETIQTAGVSAFKSVQAREIKDAKNRGQAVVNVYAGDAFLASATLACTLDNPNGPVYDAIAQRQMPYTTHIFGNHEFDYSPDFLKRFVDAFGGTQPFLSNNLDFSGEASFASLLDADGTLFSPINDGRVIGGSLVYTDSLTNQRFGIVGITTPLLPTISTPRNVSVTVDITATATVAQDAIDHLYDDLGVRKIILVSHLQDLRNDIDLVSRLKRVDLAVGGGGDEMMTNPAIDNKLELLPGDSPAKDGSGNDIPYPLVQKDADNRNVYIVTTNGNYKYMGRLDVAFDASGEVSTVYAERSYPRRVVVADAAASAVGIADAVTADAQLISDVETPIESCLNTLAATPVVRSQLLLNVDRPTLRSKESNAGNLITDGFLYVYEKYGADSQLSASSTVSNPVVAVQNGGGIRQNAGDILPTTGTVSDTISRLDTINVLPFDNFITVIPGVTATELKAVLERSAANLPGQGGQFLQVSGLKIVYNAIAPVNSRVVNVTLSDGTPLIENGTPVAGAPALTIVTNSFTARGGDNYPTLAAKSGKFNLIDNNGVAISYEQAWREYLLSLPAQGTPSLPTILASDTRYQPGGEGRITVLSSVIYLPIVAK